MIIAGIDYSLTCPGICVGDPSEEDPRLLRFYYITTVKKRQGVFLKSAIRGNVYPVYASPQERYRKISSGVMDFMEEHSVENVLMEGYAFGAKGNAVFDIAECTGDLKSAMWLAKLTFDTVPPTRIKKFFTGKGNANKTLMYESFVERTGLDLRVVFDYQGTSNVPGSPISDIVDSYAIFRYFAESMSYEILPRK